MERVEIGQHLVVDPEICHGQLTFKGTRVPVDIVLGFIGMGYSLDQVHEDWPQIPREAVTEALKLASVALQRQSGARINAVEPSQRAAS